MIGCYLRISSKSQSLENQRIAIINWLIEREISPTEVVWYEDISSSNQIGEEYSRLSSENYSSNIRCDRAKPKTKKL